MTMTNKLSARARALNLLREALDTGVRGDLRYRIQAAISTAEKLESKPGAITAKTLSAMAKGDRMADPENPGLWFRRGGRSGVVAVYRYRCPVAQAQKELRIGNWSETSGEGMLLADIRSAWRQLKAQVSAGEAPVLKVARPVAAMTVAQMCDRYVEEYAKPYKRSWRTDAGLLKQFSDAFGRFPAQDITPLMVAQLMDATVDRAKAVNPDRIDAGARQANKLRAAISKAYEFALANRVKGKPKPGQPINRISWLPEGAINPAMAVAQMGHAPEQYQPKLQDLRQWRRMVEAEKDTPHAQAMLLQALTFGWINEACRVEWSEIDMEAGTWTLPPAKTKNRKTHVVHLSDAALALLESRRDNKSKFVFPAITDPSKHLDPELVGHWWQSRREAGGLPAGMTSHALRRAGLSWVRENGGNLDIRNALSNHKPATVDDGYSKGADMSAACRDYAQRWAAHLQTLLADNVTHIAQGTA